MVANNRSENNITINIADARFLLCGIENVSAVLAFLCTTISNNFSRDEFVPVKEQ